MLYQRITIAANTISRSLVVDIIYRSPVTAVIPKSLALFHLILII